MDTDPVLQGTSVAGTESEEEAEELAQILDEVDGPSASFQKYYTKFIEKFGSKKRAKAKRKKNKVDVISDASPEQGTSPEQATRPKPKPDVDEHEYDFYNPQRGLALIINNEKFLQEAQMKDRKGSKNDAAALERMFQHLDFHVERHDNLTVKEMVLTLQKAASNKNFDHGLADCFACAILSHGGEEKFKSRKPKDDPSIRHDVVFGVDGKLVPTRYLLSIFNDECCPELEGKPRLFFIQACRGSSMDEGTLQTVLVRKKKSKRKLDNDHDHGDAVISESEDESDDEFEDAQEYVKPLNEHQKNEEKQKPDEGDKKAKVEEVTSKEREKDVAIPKQGVDVKQTSDETEKIPKKTEEHLAEKDGSRQITPNPSKGGDGDGRSSITVSPSPIYKDFLLMYAAPPGYFAWRRDTGGWLIQTLRQVLMTEDVSKQSLTRLLTKVSWSVANEYQSSSRRAYYNKKKLVPCVMSMLTKDIYFRNKVK